MNLHSDCYYLSTNKDLMTAKNNFPSISKLLNGLVLMRSAIS